MQQCERLLYCIKGLLEGALSQQACMLRRRLLACAPACCTGLPGWDAELDEACLRSRMYCCGLRRRQSSDRHSCYLCSCRLLERLTGTPSLARRLSVCSMVRAAETRPISHRLASDRLPVIRRPMLRLRSRSASIVK